jgi:hypothetical protein
VLKPEIAERIRAKQERQQLQGPQAYRSFEVGQKVWVRNFNTLNKWESGQVVARSGAVDYQKAVGNEVWHRHADQLRPNNANQL